MFVRIPAFASLRVLRARPALAILGALGAVFAVGCGLDRAPIAETRDAFDGAVMDAGDGGGLDGGLEDACVPSTEACNGRDDDCDGRSDETFSLDTDLSNCGACGNACGAGSHGSPACASGACGLGCDAGFADCDGNLGTGCEAPLDVPSSCGACGTVCSGATPVCDASGASPRCASGCSAGSSLCGASCVDLATSASNCGACGVACADRDHSTGRCEGAMCRYACDAGFADCNGIPEDGCETPLDTLTDCGACGTVCRASNASPVCASMTCALGVCNPGFGNCDGMDGTGCEDTLDSLTNCGDCGSVCARDNASATCAGDRCAIDACDPGFGDCDGMDGTGCEDTLDSLTNCGACSAVCARNNATATCAGDTCAIASCNPGFGDCDGMDGTGCEDTLDSLANCGGCRMACARDNATATCGGDTCAIATCNRGFDDCDGLDSTGCETPLNTAANCGACGTACGVGQSCVSGACVSGASVVQVGAGTSFACARISDGRVYCWGSNANGQLGDGTTTNRSSPVQVLRFNTGSTGGTTALVDATDLAVGGAHACAVRATGGVVCWGYNQRGQAGGGTATGQYTAGVAAVRRSSAMPMMNLAITDAVQVTAGGEHTCVRRTGGTVTCWGRDNEGQLGDASRGGDRGHGLDVSGLSATQVEAGTLHTCAVRADRTAQCWGDNATGALGDDSNSDTEQPVDCDLSDAVQVSAGSLFTCALRTGGGVSCWGENGNSQLGDATTTDSQTPRVATVVGGTVALEVSAGSTHACARSAGSVVCWGDTRGGRLGAMPMPTTTFATVPGLAGAQSVAAGFDVSCAALGTSGVRCWGANAAGQLGDGTTMMRMGPVTVLGLPPSP